MNTQFTKQQLNQMGESERIDLAKRLGADDVDDMNKKDMVDYIFDNQDKLDDLLSAAKKNETAMEVVAFRGRKYKSFSGKQRKIIISESEREGDPAYVYVGINGEYEAQVPRGVECVVPEEVVSVLQNLAVATVYVGEGRNQTTRQVNRFSLQMNEPVEEQVTATE